MLTKEQIKAAMDYAQMRYVDELAAAYERVTALLDEVEHEQAEQSTPTGLMFIKPLRRALEGDK